MYMFELLGKNGTLVNDQGVLLIAHCSIAARESFEGKKSWRREKDWRVISVEVTQGLERKENLFRRFPQEYFVW